MWTRSHVVPCTMIHKILQQYQRQQINGVLPLTSTLYPQLADRTVPTRDVRTRQLRLHLQLRCYPKHKLPTPCQQSPPTCNQAAQRRHSSTGLHTTLKAQYIFVQNPKNEIWRSTFLYEGMRKKAKEIFYNL